MQAENAGMSTRITNVPTEAGFVDGGQGYEQKGHRQPDGMDVAA
jgi:hypothetical protein